jgi:hypothetical protein
VGRGTRLRPPDQLLLEQFGPAQQFADAALDGGFEGPDGDRPRAGRRRARRQRGATQSPRLSLVHGFLRRTAEEARRSGRPTEFPDAGHQGIVPTSETRPQRSRALPRQDSGTGRSPRRS